MTECRFAATAEGFALSGSLGYANASSAYAEGLRVMLRRPSARLDLTGIGSIDSAGVAVILAWLSVLQDQGGHVQIHGLPAQAVALARVGGVLGLLETLA